MSVGRKIIELRDIKGMTRKDLAKKLGVTYDALSKYETDERQVDHELLIKMADFFGVTIDYLLERQTEIVAEEGLFYGLTNEERERLREQAEFYRCRKKLPEDRRDGLSGLENTDKEGKKPRYKRAK